MKQFADIFLKNRNSVPAIIRFPPTFLLRDDGGSELRERRSAESWRGLSEDRRKPVSRWQVPGGPTKGVRNG